MVKIENGLDNCKKIKTVLMVFIVLYHSLIVFLYPTWGSVLITTPSRPLGLIAEFLGSFHIYTFTLISGYIFYYIKFEKSGYQRYGAFLLIKTKRLIVPYIFVCLVWVVPITIYYFGSENLVVKYLLGTNPSQLWFYLCCFGCLQFFT